MTVHHLDLQNRAVRVLTEADELVLPMHKRVVVQYADGDSGQPELRLYYGAKEIAFDEPDLFGFGETLATTARFTAADAATWGGGHPWPRVAKLLEQLIGQGVLHYADDAPPPLAIHPGERPSPLPPAPAERARSWSECETLMAQLTGRPLELGHLELVVPIFRVAHMALDTDGRQVGEANVFPRAMRIETPTTWRSCIYAGSRHQDERPMNVTALKAMRAHWPQMMAVLLQVREAYLARFPAARGAWTVGHLERLATAVLALPTYLLMRGDRPLANGALHPALSSVFRVTDGLRMTMHQMLFVPIGEPAWAADAPITSAQIHAYAERNYSFHSEHGVCAGPKLMVDEFLAVLVDGQTPRGGLPAQLDAEVEAACQQIGPAFDYAMLGLQAYATVFSLWPAMTRAYEALHAIARDWAAQGGDPSAVILRDRLAEHVERIRRGSYLGDESLRLQREAVYEDMYGACGLGRTGAAPEPPLRARLAPAPRSRAAARSLRAILAAGSAANAPPAVLDALAATVMDLLGRQQSVLRLAAEVQQAINHHLSRTPPSRPFDARDIDLHNRLQGIHDRRLPYLIDELEDWFAMTIDLDGERLRVTPGRSPR